MHLLRNNYYYPILILVSWLTTAPVLAQDTIVPLSVNPAIIEYLQEASSSLMKREKRNVQMLPFFDDFSHGGLFPNDTLWLDRFVYISTGSMINPPSVGAVMFDGIGADGKAYSPGDLSQVSRASDTLTSTWIDLSPYQGDSIYLSFFYQAWGYGDNPESTDSLMLQFRADDGKWYWAWGVSGNAPRAFKQAMVNVNDVPHNYLYDSFQFRFVNFGNHSGNLDNWFVDYVYLNENRWPADTTYEDVAIYYPAAGITKRYAAMPWDQFMANVSGNLAESIGIYASNNSSKVKNTAFGYSITHVESGFDLASQLNAQSDNTDPFSKRLFNMKTQLNGPPAAATPKVTVLVKTAVTNIPDDFPSNDTSYRYQVFENYYAYDDGTPEAGYGLIGTTSESRVAVQFALDKPDTLYGMLIYFNQSDENVAGQQVTLSAWGDNKDNPPIATIEFVRPVYDGINTFTYFEFSQPVPVQGSFHIGWIQDEQFLLNVGVDMTNDLLYNTQYNSNKYIYTQGQWSTSNYPGHLMMRPVVGAKYVSLEKTGSQSLSINIYPNPSTGIFTLELPQYGDASAELYDLTGKHIRSYNGLKGYCQIDCENIPKGVYILRIASEERQQTTVKKLILR